jgi:hypothetical protein
MRSIIGVLLFGYTFVRTRLGGHLPDLLDQTVVDPDVTQEAERVQKSAVRALHPGAAR